MAAGGPGDHPLTDIVNYKLEVYNKECDELIREISKFVSLDRLYEMFDWKDNFSITEKQLKKFEVVLENKLSGLKEQAIKNGWEIQ
ncbi:MAG: hypothetical protein K8R54_04605 [Bacteroidales bacterium]|nr:hypothetical protein [Bacteroidales bacterium]